MWTTEVVKQWHVIIQKIQHLPVLHLNRTSTNPAIAADLWTSQCWSTSVLIAHKRPACSQLIVNVRHKLFWQPSIRIAAGQAEHHLRSQETVADSCVVVYCPPYSFPVREQNPSFNTSIVTVVSDQDDLLRWLLVCDDKHHCYKNIWVPVLSHKSQTDFYGKTRHLEPTCFRDSLSTISSMSEPSLPNELNRLTIKRVQQKNNQFNVVLVMLIKHLQSSTAQMQ